MARYTGPKVRISRRLGINVYENEKGRKALDRRPFPPGAHGRTRRRNAGSEYLAQLQEKQKVKLMYGILERQFARIFDRASRKTGITGENLLQLIEARQVRDDLPLTIDLLPEGLDDATPISQCATSIFRSHQLLAFLLG